MKKILFLFSLLILNSSIANAIEVGGHLTEDTIWNPDNNPYLVTSGVYVNSNVTLTILPGTIVKFNSAYYDDLSGDEFYFSGGEEPEAKFIRCEGKIIAEGTEQDSIIFTRMQDEEYFHWGTIYLPEGAETSIFKHCVFEYAAVTGFSLFEQVRAAVAVWNGKVSIENCSFIDNDTAVSIERNTIEISVINSYFNYVEFMHPNIQNVSGKEFFLIRYISNIDTGIPLIANNIFNNGTAISSYISIYFIANKIDSVPSYHDGMYLSDSPKGSYLYNNKFESCDIGINAFASEEDTLYIKKNYFAVDGSCGIEIHDAYVEISNNYFEGCDVYTEYASGKVFNNTSNNGEVWTPGEIEVYNNICFNRERYGLKVGYNPYCVNNISINNEYAIWSATVSYENCIIIGNEELTEHNINGNPIFRNCILDFELPEECIDGGGNIWVDSLQAEQIFEDIENGDFHLIEGSLAIDAGFDTIGYYYPFDVDYNTRVWDGDNNGSAIIDIGPYEYGAPQLGKITGYITETDSGDLVDYVLIKINNEPGNFTFADSVGYFEIQLPSATYDIYAERVFYEDNIIYSETVENEQTTEIAFNMTSTLPQINADNYILDITNYKLKNYPNPFNPETIISFSIPNHSNVELSVFNIKGQKVKTLINEKLHIGKHSIIWSGVDEHNKTVSSGIYLYKIRVNNQESVKRMILLK
ncbi:MAG: hypothetical protein DRJ01_11530 [Bacteroidetes bacterium]|nr:MAG: hypothetical protein DRJ01_11530 [Bacteroidota bacterium]